jgi:hypothetical protein
MSPSISIYFLIVLAMIQLGHALLRAADVALCSQSLQLRCRTVNRVLTI